MFWKKPKNFDELLTNIDESEKKQFLNQALKFELSQSLLEESGIKFSIPDLLQVAKFLNNDKLP